MTRWLGALALLTALGLLGWGAYLYRLETRPVLPLEVESPERDLGAVPVGNTRVAFRVTNPSDRQGEVVGLSEGCGERCCLKSLSAERISIPPGGSVEVILELTVAAEGPFEITRPLYLNDNGLRVAKLTVRGVGVLPKGAGDAKPEP